MRKKKKNELKKKALNYDNGLDSIAELFEFIVTKVNVYRSASIETVGLLETFRAALLVDQTNFKEDYDWLNNTVFDKSANDLLRLVNETEDLQEQIGISTANVENLKEDIIDTLDNIKAWNRGAAAVSGKTKLLTPQAQSCYENVVYYNTHKEF